MCSPNHLIVCIVIASIITSLCVAIDDVLHVVTIPITHRGVQHTIEGAVAPLQRRSGRAASMRIAAIDGRHGLLQIQTPWAAKAFDNAHRIEAGAIVPQL